MSRTNPHRWSTAKRVERDGEEAFERTCDRCGCISRDFEIWSKTFRGGSLVSASMRKEPHFKKASDSPEREWRESRPACGPTGGAS